MSEERSIPDALLEAVAELNRNDEHLAPPIENNIAPPPIDPLQPLENALQVLLQNIENERLASLLNFDPLQPLENTLQLYDQQREAQQQQQEEQVQQQVQEQQPREDRPAEHQEGGSRV